MSGEVREINITNSAALKLGRDGDDFRGSFPEILTPLLVDSAHADQTARNIISDTLTVAIAAGRHIIAKNTQLGRVGVAIGALTINIHWDSVAVIQYSPTANQTD